MIIMIMIIIIIKIIIIMMMMMMITMMMMTDTRFLPNLKSRFFALCLIMVNKTKK